MSSGKNYRSSKIQLFFFTVVPCIVVYAVVVLFVLGVKATLLGTPIKSLLLFIGAAWTLFGGFIIAANMSLISKIGEPSEPVLKIKAGYAKLEAVVDMALSPKQMTQLFANIFFTIVFAIPVATLGWLLFILYCKGVFLKKLSRMAKDCDLADELIENGGDAREIAECAYRMLDYAEVYKNLGEKKGANKMIERSQKLMRVWETLSDRE